MKSIGILGGGQLAKLLALKASELGLKAFVLSASDRDPAAQNNPFWIQGDPRQAKDLKAFFSLADAVTFESEFFSTKHIEKAWRAVRGKKPYIAPSLKALSLIQDRWTQKRLLSQYKINTSDFFKITLKTGGRRQLYSLWEKLGPFVLKSRTGGYDGYGTFMIKKKAQIKTKSLPSLPFIAERLVPFKRELSLLSARNKKGQIVFFPLAESFQKNFRCLWVRGPARHIKLPALKTQIKTFLKGLNYQGVMAFELFDTGDDLMVNELAPRVHNTGHYSLDALSEDQFTAQVKAIINRPLAKPQALAKGFAMLNLLGEGCQNPSLKLIKQKKALYLNSLNKPSLKISQSIKLWWYGKSVSRKGRKMGHLSAVGPSAQQALDKLAGIRAFFKI